MAMFTLNTFFSDTDLERFNTTGTNIVVAKPSADGKPNVAWNVYRPLRQNCMSWEENYGIYASNTEIQNGAFLCQLSPSDYPAAIDKMYTFLSSGHFSTPNPGGEKGSYSILNQYDNLPKGYLTMGLYQNATVDGEQRVGNAVSAAPVLYNSTAKITPYTIVYLWTQSGIKSNTVVTTVTSEMTQVTFGGTTTNISLVYDPTSGKFMNKGLAADALEAGITLKHISPNL